MEKTEINFCDQSVLLFSLNSNILKITLFYCLLSLPHEKYNTGRVCRNQGARKECEIHIISFRFFGIFLCVLNKTTMEKNY